MMNTCFLVLFLGVLVFNNVTWLVTFVFYWKKMLLFYVAYFNKVYNKEITFKGENVKKKGYMLVLKQNKSYIFCSFVF
ncbi:hypothetical protein HanIR_Chr07g0316741 [Helianthus annuus]|nr:hypothetical protein HanIR_Chr07g0316741 [Helianthus annuus]